MSNEIKTGVLLTLKDKFSQGIRSAGSAAQNFASGAMKAVQGVDKAFSGLGTAAGALGVSLSVGAAARDLISLDSRLTRIGLTADASAEQIAKLKQEVFDAATDSKIKIDTTGITEALDVVMTKTGDIRYVEDNIRNIAVAMQATGESGEAIGSVFSEFQKYGYSAGQITKLMDDMVKQGDQGAFTFGKFAQLGSTVISAYAPIGTAPENLKKANAAMQILMAGTKNENIAATALESTMAELSDPAKQQKLRSIGVSVRDSKGNFRDFNDIMKDVLDATKKFGGGNTDFLGNIFGQTSMRAIRAYDAFYEKMFPNLMELGDTTGAMEAKSARMAGTLAANLQQVKTSFLAFADSNLTKPLEQLSNALNYLAENPERYKKVFTGIAAGIGAIAAVKGIAGVANLIGSLKNLKSGKLDISAGSAGGMGIPVHVTNWGGREGSSLLSGTQGNGAGASPAGNTNAGANSFINKNASWQGMKGAASQAVNGLTAKQYAAGGAASGIGAAMVAIPKMMGELGEIKNDETLSDKEKSVKKGGAIGDATGTVIGATAGGVAGVAAGAAVGAAVGSVVPVLGTAVGALVGAGIGALGGWLGGKAGRAIGEGIGGAVAGNEEIGIPTSILPPQITSQSEPYLGQTTDVSGEVGMKLSIDISGDKPKVTESSMSTLSGGRIKYQLGSTEVSRSMQ